MANLTYLDKKLLEDLLGMGGGWVLDFSDATYAAFFRDLGIDIEQQRFHINGRSKAKRMRALWEISSNGTAGKVLNSLFEYIEATNPEGAGGPVEERHRKIAQRLLGAPAEKTKLTESEFLAAEFGQVNLKPLGLENAMEKVVNQRLNEVRNCLAGGSPLAAIMLCGSTLEALLLNVATKTPSSFNQANASPKDTAGKTRQFHEWSLNDLINVACEVGKIGLDVKKFSHALRDFRNYIHPYEQVHSRFDPDLHTAKISWQVLKAAIADLSGRR